MDDFLLKSRTLEISYLLLLKPPYRSVVAQWLNVALLWLEHHSRGTVVQWLNDSAYNLCSCSSSPKIVW